MVQHVFHRDRQCIRLALYHDPERVSDQDGLDPSLFDNASKQRIVGRDHDDFFPVALILLKFRNRHIRMLKRLPAAFSFRSNPATYNLSTSRHFAHYGP